MPGNDIGERVHNFFPQDNLSQGQIVDGNWPVVNNNLWGGTPTQVGLPNSNTKTYNLHHSDNERGQSSHSVHGQGQGQHGMNFTHPSQSQQQINLNGDMYGNRFQRQNNNEGNFMGVVDNNNTGSRYEGNSPVHETKSLFRSSETCESPVSFDLFGSQQMNHLHSLQQSGYNNNINNNNSEHFQQQLMLRKMQELQRQQQIQQLQRHHQFQQQQIDPRQQIQRRQIDSRPMSPFAKQLSGGSNYPSPLSNGSPISDHATNPEPTPGNINWLQRASPAFEGSSTMVPSNLGQHSLMDQSQSLYGVPIASSRGGHFTHFSQISADNNNNQYMVSAEQGTNSNSNSNIQRYPSENLFGQPLTPVMSMENLQLMHRHGKQQEKSLPPPQPPQQPPQPPPQPPQAPLQSMVIQQNEVPLDPTEERILFGSDDNIWSAFAKSPSEGGVGEAYDSGNGETNGLQGGSWSALMQSAVAETASCTNTDIPIIPIPQQQDWTGLNFQVPVLNQHQNTSLRNVLPHDNYQNVQGRHNMFGSESGKRQMVNSSQRNIPSSEEGNNSWLNSVPGPDLSSIHGVGTDQSVLGQQYGKPNGWNVSQSGDETQGNSNNNTNLWNSRTTPMPTNIDAHMNRDTMNLRNVTAFTQNATTTRFNEESNLSPFNSYQLNHWRNVNPSVVKPQGSNESMERSNPHHVLNKDSQVMEPIENYNRKDNSSDGYGVVKENGGGGLKDVSDSQFGKNKSVVNQIGRKKPGPRKFQHHPMGNLDDIGASSGMKQQPMSHFGHTPKTSMQLDKDQSTHQNDVQGIDATTTPSLGRIPGQIQKTTGPFNQSEDRYNTPNKDSQSSDQNMLELLHKVDQSRDHGQDMRLTSSGGNVSSELPEAENSEGSEGRLQWSQSSASQGFGLCLGPPSTRIPLPNQSLTTPSNLYRGGEKGQSNLAPPISSVQSLPPTNERITAELKNNRSGLTNPLINKLPYNSGFPYSRSPLQYTQNTRVATDQHQHEPSLDTSSSLGPTSQQIGTNDANAKVSSPQLSVVKEPVPVPVSKPQGTSLTPNMWTNVPGQTHVSGVAQSHIPQLHQPKILESTSCVSHKQGDQDTRTGWNIGSSLKNKESPSHQVPAKNVVHNKDELQGPEPVPKNISDESSAKSASVQQDLEAFGRNLKSNKFLHHNYSLLNQMRTMKNAEPEPRVLKKMKGPESSVESIQEALKDAQSSENSTVIGDESAKILNFSEKKTSSQQNMETSQINNSVSVITERPQISPQMAPSWFSQYGSFKNGQIQSSMHDSHRVSITNTLEKPLIIGKSSSDLHTPEQIDSASVDNNIQPTIQTENLSSQQAPLVKVSKPKKRKRDTFHLTPWHKEVSQGYQSLQTISLSETQWAKAANRLTEKVEEEVGLIEDKSVKVKAKRRLTLTTKLMQQLIHPPKPAIILCEDANSNSNYESVAYSITRVALGDACGVVCKPSIDPEISHDGVTTLVSDKFKDKKVTEQHLFKVVEDFMGRARNLENEFLRLNKKASVVDLRVDCQELEKFSVINRFAKFHGRGQVVQGQSEGGESSSTSDGNASLLKPLAPQRYVTAQALPRNLPDRVQCLSL